jgi:hypothetical protein
MLDSLSDFWPPIIRKFSEEKMNKKYPELKNEHLSLGEMPGGAIIESEMMTMMRYTTSAALIYTPLEWFRSRRLALTAEQKAKILITPNFKRNMALGAAIGAATGLAKAFIQYGMLTEEQVVDMAIGLRRDKVQDRWSRTTARMASMSVVPMILYTQGSLPMRVACGFAIGTVLSIPVSYTELDFAFTYALPG